MSAAYRATDTFRNSSVQFNLTTSLRLSTTGVKLIIVSTTAPGLSIRLPGQSRSRHRSQPSDSYPVYLDVAKDCYRLVYGAYCGMVNTQYRVDHRASKRYNLTALNSLLSTDNTSAQRPQPATHRRHDYHRQSAVTAIGNTSPPPLPATLLCYRFRQPLPTTPQTLRTTHRSHRYR